MGTGQLFKSPSTTLPTTRNRFRLISRSLRERMLSASTIVFKDGSRYYGMIRLSLMSTFSFHQYCMRDFAPMLVELRLSDPLYDEYDRE